MPSPSPGILTSEHAQPPSWERRLQTTWTSASPGAHPPAPLRPGSGGEILKWQNTCIFFVFITWVFCTSPRAFFAYA